MVGYIDDMPYGKVDRIPGVGYVVTTFTHWCFLPLFPQGSAFVFDAAHRFKGSSDSIPLSKRSVVSGYARTWCLFLVFVFTFVGMGNLETFLTAHKIGPRSVRVAFVVAYFAIMLAVVVPSRLSVVLQVYVHAATLVAWGLWMQAGAPTGAGGRPGLFGVTADVAIANVALFVHNLTYLWNYASEARKAELMARHADILGPREPPRAPDPDSPPIVMPVTPPAVVPWKPPPKPRPPRWADDDF